jgi:two-component system, LytTR family, response regulator
MTLRALVVDDERLARVVLRSLLADHPDIEVVAEAGSVDSAVDALAEHDPDLVFLEVQMPGDEGTRLFERTDVRAWVIFVTAFDHYAVQAFQLNALDYLLKPVEPDRLAVALERARDQPRPVTALEQTPQGPLDLDELLCLPHRGGMRFFRVRDITHFSAEVDYCKVHLEDGSSLLSNTALKDWDDRLPTPFQRVHRSFVVNLDRARRVVRDGSAYVVVLDRGEPVPMSRRHGARLLKQGRLGGGT